MSSPSSRPPVITDRDLETLAELEAANKNLTDVGHRGGWAKPMDCGGFNGSHHSKTLQKLVAMGFVDASRAPGRIEGFANARPGISYKITEAGAARIEQARAKRRKS